MNAPADMIVFGEDWGRHPSSTQHLVRRLAERRRVVWVNSIGLRRPRPSRSDLSRVMNKLVVRRQVSRGSVAPPASISIVPPLAVSWPASQAAALFNRAVVGHQVRRAAKQRGLEAPVLWTSLPSALPLVGTLGERAVVYYCGDDFGALAGVDHEPVLQMEHELVERADLIVAASEALAARFPANRTLLLPHGADIEMFQDPAPRPFDLPACGKIAGFYGSISDWIDVDLLATVAGQLADWTFVMIGDVRTDVTKLLGLPNVRLLGPRAHADLPAYVQHWTVSLLPFRDCPQIHACNPLKLREYMAAGTPVVSTPFPALAPFRDLVHVGASPESFATAIGGAAQDWRRNLQRKAIVAGDSWEARAATLDDALARL